MRSIRSGPANPAQRPRAPLALCVIGGGATAGVAGYYLGPAWSDARDCGKAGGGCAAHPFWGFAPEAFLVACVVGVVVGAALILVGLLAHSGRVGGRFAGLLVIALGLLGAVAYGGFGVGAAAAVAAGTLWAFPRRPVPGSPEEWSGSLPPGVPPAPRPSGRAMPDRPSVTEWHGAVAAGRPGPPGAFRGKVSLPTADRLAEALKRSRLSVDQPGSEAYPSPVIVLPPPPKGLRATVGPTTVSKPTGPDATSTVADTEALDSLLRTGSLRSSGLTAARAPPSRPPVGPDAPPLPVRAKTPAAPTPTGAGGGSSAAASPPPPPASPVPVTGPSGSRGWGPLRVFRPSLVEARAALRSSSPPKSDAGLSRPGEGRTAGDMAAVRQVPSATGPLQGTASVATPRTSPAVSSSPAVPVSGPWAPKTDRPSVEAKATVAGRPPQPTTPAAKPRTRAWRCPKCGLVNAPWTVHCTRCKTAAPARR